MADEPQVLSSDDIGAVRVPTAADGAVFGADELGRITPPDKQSYLKGLARSMLGQGALLGWGDEVMAKLRSVAHGEKYEDALKDERAKVKEFRTENPKMALAAELGGGFLTPGMGLLSGVLKPAATMAGRLAQGVGVGSGIGAVAGAGAAEGDESTLEGAKKGAGFGAVVGPAAPLLGGLAVKGVNALTDVAGPTLARFGARLPGAKSTPAEAAADFVQAREMQSLGITPAMLRDRLAAVDRDRTFHGGVGAPNASEAQTPIMLGDITPKLAGAVVRASPEAGARAEATLGARQTGITPNDAKAQAFVDEAGITHRNPLSEVPKNAVLEAPAGQHERLYGAQQRAYTLADKDFHGHSENAYLTEKNLREAMKVQENKLYGDFRAAQKGYDVRRDMQPAITKWTDKLADPETQVDEGNIIRMALRAFTTDGADWVKSVDAIDKGKRALDAKIYKAKQGGDFNRVRLLKDVQADFVDAGNNVEFNGIGEKWKAAREYSSGERQKLDALQWGRDALKLDSNASADQFAAFDSEDLKKMARLGILESLKTASGPKTRATDLTRVLDTNRAQDLLRETIPRAGGSGPYSVQPERFGNYVGTEKQFIGSRDKILGNSATAGRLADDERLTRQTLATMFDRFKSGNLGLVPMALEAVSAGLTKVFGYREDVSRELGRRLFTANRADMDRIISRLEAQWGVDKVGTFTRLLDKATTAGAVALPAAGARSIGERRAPQ